MYRVTDGEYRRWLKVTVRSLDLLIDWNWDASVQRKVRGLAVSGPVVLVTANLFTWLFEYSNINCIKHANMSQETELYITLHQLRPSSGSMFTSIPLVCPQTPSASS